MNLRLILVFVFFGSLTMVRGQESIFNAPAQVCIDQSVITSNTSSGATSYLWDFCQDGLTHAVGANPVVDLSSATPAIVTPEGIDIANDNGNWFGFALGRDNSILYRIEFGTSLSNLSPTVTSLGNIEGKFSGPTQIEVVQDNGNWYGFVTNFYSSKIIRLNFGSSLANDISTITATDLGLFGPGAGPRGLDIIKNGSGYSALVSYWDNTLILLDFDTGINSPPTLQHTISNGSAFLDRPLGVSLQEEDGKWYGLVANYSNGKILHLDFGTNLFSDPVFSTMTTLPGSTDVALLKDGLKYYGFIEAPDGLVRIDFNEGLTVDGTETISSADNYGNALVGLYGLSFVKDGAEWRAFTLSQSNNQVHKIDFTDVCGGSGASLKTSTDVTPSNLSYSQAGTYYIELTAYSSTGAFSSTGQSITVQNLTAPAIDFSTDNACVTQQNAFTASIVDPSVISSWSWDFGDGNTDNSNNAIVSHQYGSVGNNQVKLSVIAQNTCTAEVTKTISIYNPVSANFDLPVGSMCTNSVLLFDNTTVYDPGANPSWKWFVDGIEVSTAENLSHIFASTGAHSIKLNSSIPGCQDEQTQVITLNQGPTVQFSYTNNCFEQPIQFTNETTGSGITSFIWDFGDGATESSQSNAQHEYTSSGTYAVKLTVSNDLGCANEHIINLTVNDQPLADFTTSDATENLPVNFTGQDLTLADDQVNSWNWDFNSVGQDQGVSVAYTFPSPGLVPVSVSVTTNQGCSFTVSKDIMVATATVPTISISANSTACLDETIYFENNTVNASSYLWDFCQDGLEHGAGANLIVDLSSSTPAIVSPEGIKVVNDAGNWYVFALGRDNSTLYRIDFGASLANPSPIVNSLGNVDGKFSQPTQIEIIKDEENWYGFVTNFADSKIIRLDFGNSLSVSSPTATDLGTFGSGTGPRGFDILKYSSGYAALISYWNNHTLELLDFSNGLASAPSTSYTISNSTDHLQNPVGVSLQEEDGKWYGLVANYSNGKILHLDFGTSLFSDPVFSTMTTLPGSTDVALLKDGLKYYGFIEAPDGFVRIDFNEDLTVDGTETISSADNYGNALVGLYGLSFAKEGAEWRAFTLSQSNNQVHKIDFTDVCGGSGASLKTSTDVTPSNLSYSQAGTYYIELTAYSSTGGLSSTGKSITVQNLTAPAIDFSTDNACITQQNAFTASIVDPSIISSWSWDFGDGNTDNSNNAIVSHQYGSVGNNQVKLSVIAQNTCPAEITKTISIYNSLVANFDLPVGSKCTNSLLSFNNTTVYDNGANTSWNWFVDDIQVSTAKNLDHTFILFGSHSVKLRASILGCQDEKTQVITLSEGPTVQFSYANNCYQQPIQFTNETTGAGITSFLWDFGDGETESSQSNTQHQYTNAGTYAVKLTVNDDQGCANEDIVNLTVNDQPLADFINSNAVENLPVNFTGQDLTLADDQINQWNWNFNSLSQDQGVSVTYTFPSPGLVPISLSVTTDQGCSFSLTKDILVDVATVPTISISNSSTACLGETIYFQNNTVNASTYLWDFCQDGLTHAVGANLVVELSSATPSIVTPEGIDIANDHGNWFGFALGRDNNMLYRIDFGTSLSNLSPTVTSLGNIDNKFSLPTQIEVLNDNGNWFGFVTNFGNSKIIRLDFGNSLSANVPIATDLGTFGSGAGPRGLDLIKYTSGYAALVSYWNNDTLMLLDFSSGLSNAPIDSYTISNTAGHLQNPVGVSLQADDGKWYALVANSSNGKILHLDFGANLFSDPVFSTMTTAVGSTDVALLKDGLAYYGFIETPGGLVRIDFKEDLHLDGTETISIADNYDNSLVGLYGLSFAKEGAEWRAFTVSQSNSKIHKIDFSDNCSASGISIKSSTAFTPIDLTYSISGNYLVEFIAYSSSGSSSYMGKSIMIQNLSSPSVDFSTDFACTERQNTFTSLVADPSSIATWSWDFGDGSIDTSNNATVSHQYSLAGKYHVALQILTQNGCNNFTVRDIDIFNPPISSFVPPIIVGDPICSNVTYNFVNNSSYAIGSNPIWEWTVNNEVVSNQENLAYSYKTSSDQIIALKASILGCSNTSTQTVTNIQQGPLPDFSVEGICEDLPSTFTNKSVGQIDSFTWDLGDNSSLQTDTDLNHTYSEIGAYLVKLTANATNGCYNFTTKEVVIRSRPQPNFSLDLPPFSCSGAPSQFNDLTPAPTDSNISSWNWSFGDTANGTSSIKNPSYIYELAGSYDVSLKTISNFGCEATKLKTIQIAESPKADFLTSSTCLNKTSYFTDASSGTNKAWLWKIGNSSYTLQNPAHVFSITGNYSAQLTVTGNNDCISVLSKPVNIPVPPILDFSVQNNCAGQSTLFEDGTFQTADPAVSRAWDFGGKGNGSGASTQFSFATPGTYNVKLTVTNESGCNYSLSRNTTIVTAPVANFTTSVESGPAPLGVQFTNASLNATSFQWRFNDPANSTSTEMSPSFTYTSLGDFIVDLTASNEQGCLDIESNIIHVIIPYSEIALEEFTLLHDALTGSVRPVLSIKNNSNYTINSVNVILDIAGNALVKERVNTTILPNTSSSQILNYELLPGGSHLAYLCAEVQLADDSNLMNNSACISLESDEILFTPYPNPIESELHLDWISPETGSAKISVVSQLGQMSYQKDVPDVEVGLNQTILDLSKLNSGLYLLIFESQGRKKTFSISILN